MKILIGLLFVFLVGTQAKAVDRDQRSLAVSDESDELFDGPQLNELDVAALASLTDMGDDLSSDAELSDTLDRLLAASEVDEDPALLAASSSAQSTAAAKTETAESEHTTAEQHAEEHSEHQEHTEQEEHHDDQQEDQHEEQHESEEHVEEHVETAQPEPALLAAQSSAKVETAVAAKTSSSTATTTTDSAKLATASVSAKAQQASKEQQLRDEQEMTSEDDEEWNEEQDLPRFQSEIALKAAIHRMASKDVNVAGSALESQGGTNPTHAEESLKADRIKAAMYMVLGLVGVVAVIEVVTQTGEMALRQAASPVEKVLSKTYKPLTVITIGSFLLICFARYQWLDQIAGDYTQSFIFDLLLIMFVMGATYVLAMMCILAYSSYVVDQWAEIEKKYRTDAAVQSLENHVAREKERYDNRHCCTRFWLSCFVRYRVRNLEFELRYCQLKQQFVAQHSRRFMAAPVGSSPVQILTYQTLDFHVYLRRCMHLVCQELASIHWQVWLVIFSVVFLNAMRMLIFKSVDTISFIYISVVMLWVMLIYSIILHYQITSVTQEVTEHYRHYLPERPAADAAPESDDPDDELLKEEGTISGSCGVCAQWCCSGKACDCACARYCCPQPSKQQELFCCKSPSSVTRAMQLAILMTALIIPAYCIDLNAWITNQATWQKLLINILMGIAPIVTIIFIIPTMIPQFVISVSVASMTRLSDLRYTLLKINSTTYRTSKRLLQEKERQEREARIKAAAAGGLESKDGEFPLSSGEDDDDDDDEMADLRNSEVGAARSLNR